MQKVNFLMLLLCGFFIFGCASLNLVLPNGGVVKEGDTLIGIKCANNRTKCFEEGAEIAAHIEMVVRLQKSETGEFFTFTRWGGAGGNRPFFQGVGSFVSIRTKMGIFSPEFVYFDLTDTDSIVLEPKEVPSEWIVYLVYKGGSGRIDVRDEKGSVITTCILK